MPVPKNNFHNRFTATRAVSGLSFITVHWARPRRSAGAPIGKGGNADGVPAETFSVGWA